MARGAAGFAQRPARPTGGEAHPLFVNDRLDIHQLHRLLEAAQVVVEGARYLDAGRALFSGSALIDLDLLDAPIHPRSSAIARRLAAALRSDGRVDPIVRARAAAAMSALLGHETPGDWECTWRARAEGLRVRLDVEMEAPLSEGYALG